MPKVKCASRGCKRTFILPFKPRRPKLCERCYAKMYQPPRPPPKRRSKGTDSNSQRDDRRDER